MQSFWEQLHWPVVGLSPMDGVTDAAFRRMLALHGKPDVMFTEFTSVDGIVAGATRLLRDFEYVEDERPIVAQLFGGNPEHFYAAAVICGAMGFDGIDINMGCPAKNVTHHGAGAALIKDPERALAILAEARRGVVAWADGIALDTLDVPTPLLNMVQKWQDVHPQKRQIVPVSVKTRTGYAEIEVETWIAQLCEAQPAVITVHGRTLKQLYSGVADWEAIRKAAAVAHAAGIRLLGNGDVANREDALAKVSQYGVDGVLLGRASQGNPWVFIDSPLPSREQRLAAALEHARLFTVLAPDVPFLAMRKHLLDYVKGMPDAKELRSVLMRVNTYNETEDYLSRLIFSFHASPSTTT